MRKTSVMMIASIAVLVMLENVKAEMSTSNMFTPSPRTRQEIDRELFIERLIQGSFVKWVRASPTANGYFKSAMNRRWQAQRNQKSHLISQTRLLYVMAQAYELTGERRYLNALKKGADFLLRYYAAPQDGTWYWRVSSKGQLQSRSTRKQHAYGQAFVMFGLSHAYRVTEDQRYLNAALDTWDHAEGLQVINASRVPFRGYSQNGLMHTFEALLLDPQVF